MRYFKVILALLMLILLTACGCEHEWIDATCQAPKTCALCGKSEGDVTWHDWLDPDCFTPYTCSVCGLTEGEPLEHEYSEGFCTRCYAEDPSYVNLENYGFYNMYGMNDWVQITAYDFGEGTVSVDGHGYSVWDYSFETSYILEGKIISGSFEKSSNTDTVFVYDIIDNDSLVYDSNKSWVIYDRVVNQEKEYLVLKTQRKGKDMWFVPSDLIDWTYELENNVRYLKS